MIRNLLLVCTTLLLGTLSIFALTSRVPRADFTYVNPAGIHTLDPARMSWTQDFRVALNIWEGLTTWHPRTLEPIEGAAVFPPELSADRLIYTFAIREDARWSNGDPVTADDFIRGWRRGMEPGTATDYTFLFTDHIVGAADYVQWRRDGVAVLTALSRLRDGVGITARQAKALWRDAVNFPPSRNAFPLPPITPPATEDDLGWARFAEELPRVGLDWSALHTALFEEHAGQLEDRFRHVGVSAPDDRTLVVRLTRPCPYFLDLTAFPTFLPCHHTIELLREQYRGAPLTAEGLVVYDPQWTKPDYPHNGYAGLVTNGPYRLADWTFKRRARLEVNPFFRSAAGIQCRTVDMLEYDNISASIMAYEAGEADFLTSMKVPYDHELVRRSRSGERPDFHECVVLATHFLNFNCAAAVVDGHPNPFVDSRVRKAFTLAADRERIVDNVLQRGDRVAYTFVPAGAIPRYESPHGLRRDVDEARRLLAEAGYPGGARLPPIEILYTTTDERVCQTLARIWENSLGVRAELRCKESKTFAEDKANRRFMVAPGDWYADYNDPTTFLDCLSTGNGNNDCGYSSPRYDALLKAAGDAFDPAIRAGLLRQAETVILEQDCPILPMLHHSELIAIQPYVRGLQPNPRLWFPFRYVHFER